jgi:nuclear pore complex protein Nup62
MCRSGCMHIFICKYVWTHFLYVFFCMTFVYLYAIQDVWMYICICMYVYIYVCEFVCVFIIIYRYKKCDLKKIRKVVGHDMYIIDITVCGSYGNF